MQNSHKSTWWPNTQDYILWIQIWGAFSSTGLHFLSPWLLGIHDILQLVKCSEAYRVSQLLTQNKRNSQNCSLPSSGRMSQQTQSPLQIDTGCIVGSLSHLFFPTLSCPHITTLQWISQYYLLATENDPSFPKDSMPSSFFGFSQPGRALPGISLTPPRLANPILAFSIQSPGEWEQFRTLRQGWEKSQSFWTKQMQL